MLVQKKILKQMVIFNKNAFDSAFAVISSLQAQTERMLNIYLNKAAGFPEEGKKALNEWMEVYNKGSRDFHNAVHENFIKVDKFFEISKM
jgi:hypothetical protein